jgi:hypothetical protein
VDPAVVDEVDTPARLGDTAKLFDEELKFRRVESFLRHGISNDAPLG